MLEILWQLAIFFLGMHVGKTRANNMETYGQSSTMQQILNEAYQERDSYKMSAMYAQQQAETWKRRYESLLTQKGEPSKSNEVPF